MIIRSVQGLGNSFYKKSEVEFLGTEINFKFMTPNQLDVAIAESTNLYNKLYPPTQKSGFNKFMKNLSVAATVGGIAVVTGGAVLAAYGIGAGTAAGAVFGAGSATAATGSTIATIQTSASYIAGAGILYGKVTGETPEDLVKVAKLVTSENALSVMETVAKDELMKKGMGIQSGDKSSNEALRERLKKEQLALSEKMMIAADQKAQALGQPTPEKKKIKGMEILAIATPFVLYFLG